MLRKRGYITASHPSDQESEVLALYGKSSVEAPSTLAFAARRSNTEEKLTSLQQAWAACVRSSAQLLHASPYSPEILHDVAISLPRRAQEPASFVEFQKLFATAGVKIVYVESFPEGKLDGCALRVDHHPIIGVSGRGKRLDKVLFTILHEAAHVFLGHVDDEEKIILDDLSANSTQREDEADRLAKNLLILQLPALPNTIEASWIEEQAARLQIHPIVLVGRLQSEGILSWRSTLSRHAPSVTEYLRQWERPLPTPPGENRVTP
nr:MULTISPECIES: ImmA/IrrE family metallo-endopeptidase [unclassified Corynebacterium]